MKPDAPRRRSSGSGSCPRRRPCRERGLGGGEDDARAGSRRGVGWRGAEPADSRGTEAREGSRWSEGFAGDFGRRVAGRADDVRRWCERGSAGAHLGRRAAGRRPHEGGGMAACGTVRGIPSAIARCAGVEAARRGGGGQRARTADGKATWKVEGLLSGVRAPRAGERAGRRERTCLLPMELRDARAFTRDTRATAAGPRPAFARRATPGRATIGAKAAALTRPRHRLRCEFEEWLVGCRMRRRQVLPRGR